MRYDKRLEKIYKKLFDFFGPQSWWPAQTRLEVIVGAMLTQNTAWLNVEKAVANLKKKKLINLEGLCKIEINELAGLIKPAGYFNIKAKRLKNLIKFLKENSNGSLGKIKKQPLKELRDKLLSVNGVGPETADSILLYAFDKPIFVVDAYTKRIFSRLKIVLENSTYEDIQKLFMENLPKDIQLFNEYHALIVKLGKDYCKKNNPKCNECPLKDEH